MIQIEGTPLITLIAYDPLKPDEHKALIEATSPTGEVTHIWMSKKNIQNNIDKIGMQSGLRKALEAYEKNQQFIEK